MIGKRILVKLEEKEDYEPFICYAVDNTSAYFIGLLTKTKLRLDNRPNNPLQKGQEGFHELVGEEVDRHERT